MYRSALGPKAAASIIISCIAWEGSGGCPHLFRVTVQSVVQSEGAEGLLDMQAPTKPGALVSAAERE